MDTVVQSEERDFGVPLPLSRYPEVTVHQPQTPCTSKSRQNGFLSSRMMTPWKQELHPIEEDVVGFTLAAYEQRDRNCLVLGQPGQEVQELELQMMEASTREILNSHFGLHRHDLTTEGETYALADLGIPSSDVKILMEETAEQHCAYIELKNQICNSTIKDSINQHFGLSNAPERTREADSPFEGLGIPVSDIKALMETTNSPHQLGSQLHSRMRRV